MEDVLTVGAFNLRHLAASEIAERALVGAVIVNPTATFESVKGIVSSEDFSNGEVASVYGALERMHAAGEPLDDVCLVSSRLKLLGVLDAMGGNAGIVKAAEHAMPHHAVFYATEIRKYARIKRAREAALAILAECELDNASLQRVAVIAAKRLLGLCGAMEVIEHMKGTCNATT